MDSTDNIKTSDLLILADQKVPSLVTEILELRRDFVPMFMNVF
jgi:hypothetical protein